MDEAEGWDDDEFPSVGDLGGMKRGDKQRDARLQANLYSDSKSNFQYFTLCNENVEQHEKLLAKEGSNYFLQTFINRVFPYFVINFAAENVSNY